MSIPQLPNYPFPGYEPSSNLPDEPPSRTIPEEVPLPNYPFPGYEINMEPMPFRRGLLPEGRLPLAFQKGIAPRGLESLIIQDLIDRGLLDG